jgi:hypothetical protein
MLEQMLALEDAIKILNKACGQCSNVTPLWTKCYSIRLHLERALTQLLNS